MQNIAIICNFLFLFTLQVSVREKKIKKNKPTGFIYLQKST